MGRQNGNVRRKREIIASKKKFIRKLASKSKLGINKISGNTENADTYMITEPTNEIGMTSLRSQETSNRITNKRSTKLKVVQNTLSSETIRIPLWKHLQLCLQSTKNLIENVSRTQEKSSKRKD